VDETQTATLRSIKALSPIQQAGAQDDLEPLSQKNSRNLQNIRIVCAGK
jgi:hypothetical protein